jgi:ribonuclease E
VTCPRCNGVGVIRDTESSALHILRILQEEAMKENTAAVHAQVPVEVATFLLNEKRADIAKLEARLRVSVVLIPNKFLETPHYHIERLRHDDPRLDNLKASFERAAEFAPSTDTPYAALKEEAERERPRQEAVVKGVVPETPAPVSIQPAAEAAGVPVAQAAPPPASGLWSRIVSFFTGGPAAPPAAPAPVVSKPAGERPARDEERRGERRRGRHDRDGRRDGKRDEKRGERREERRDGKRDESRRGEPKQDTRERRAEGKPQEPRPSAEAQEGRKPRGERRPPKERVREKPEVPAAEPVEPTPAALEAAEVTAAPALLVSADGATEVPQEERRGRPRPPRGRGGPPGAESAAPVEGQTAPPTGQEDEFEAEEEAVEAEAAEAVTLAAAAVKPPATQAPAMAPAPVVAPPVPVVAAGIAALHTPDMITVPATVVVPAVQPAPLPVEQLQSVLDLAGLTLVQTEPAKRAEAAARMALEPAPVRVPRERPVLPPLVEAPLEQVETRPSSAQNIGA